MTQALPRSIYSCINELGFKTSSACALLGISDITLKKYVEKSGVDVLRSTRGVPVRLYDINNLFQLTEWRRNNGSVKIPKKGSKPVFITINGVKGGTGKTTTAVETAFHLQFLGLRVLAIDLDVQANLTQYFGYQDDLLPSDLPNFGLSEEALITSTFASVVRPFLESRRVARPMQEITGLIKKPFGEFGPHCIGSDAYLTDIEKDLSISTGARELAFRSLFEQSLAGGIPGFDLNNYDVVIMDCPPNMSLTSTAALAAADIVIAPVRMESFAVKGLVRLVSEINNLNRDYNFSPELIFLPTLYRPALGKFDRMQQALNKYMSFVCPTVISFSEDLCESRNKYTPFILKNQKSLASRDYKIFAEYIHKKILQISK